MEMKAATTVISAISGNSQLGWGLRGLYSYLYSLPFNLPQNNVEKPPLAEFSTDIFVSSLSKRTTNDGLRDAFAKFGEVVHVKVVTDRVSGYSKGFGFVKYATVEEAGKGNKGMDGKFLDGWVIFAEYAKPRPPLHPLNNTPGRQGHW